MVTIDPFLLEYMQAVRKRRVKHPTPPAAKRNRKAKNRAQAKAARQARKRRRG